jgi:hypothetical protein
MHAGAAALGDGDDIARSGGVIGRRQRHRLSRHRQRHQAETEGERRCSKYLHRGFPFFSFCALRPFRRNATDQAIRKQCGRPVTRGVIDANDGDANADASDVAANPSADGANADANDLDDASAPARASDDRRRAGKQQQVPRSAMARAPDAARLGTMARHSPLQQTLRWLRPRQTRVTESVDVP